ncbi:MAG: Fe-S cluster assembly ATPase SufC [Parcubacteria group bacterium]|jgi:Fe-S cluster assembly ATP-binding protein
MLSINNLSVQADEKTIIHTVSYDFAPGKIYAIMGVNGSGKSTLAKTIMGDPSLRVLSGDITLDQKNITSLPPQERAHLGIFLAPQSPLAIPGVTVQQLLRTAIPRDTQDSATLLKRITDVAQDLDMKKELLSRSLNENFSGGERKKMEMLQAAILDPRYIILDEIDTGVDVDALATIATFIKKMKTNDPQKTFIIITHYNRILSQLPVDEVLIMHNGTITEHGDAALAEKIEKDGYKK